MVQLTEKENYMRLMHGEIPEWIPMYAFNESPDGKPTSQRKVFPEPLFRHRATREKAKDIWGVTYVAVDGGKMPEPNNFILEDIWSYVKI